MSTVVMRTNRNRKVEWRGEYTNSGKCLRCYMRGGAVVYVNRATGRSEAGQNGRSKVPIVKPATAEWGDREWITQEEMAKVTA